MLGDKEFTHDRSVTHRAAFTHDVGITHPVVGLRAGHCRREA